MTGSARTSPALPFTPTAGAAGMSPAETSSAAADAAQRDLRRVLLVDDEAAIRLALAKLLRAQGFEVDTADSGMAALDLLGRERFALMICDIRMPGISGLDVIPRALALDSDLAIMMLTAVDDAVSATDALSQGALDYLLKPLELPELLRAAERALHRRTLAIERRRVEQMIREEVALRTEELEREKRALRLLTVNVAETLINAMEAKDVYLRGHSQRVADLGAALAEQLGLDADTVEDVRLAGRLHDIGKIGIRESVLNKPDKLTPAEFAHVRDHVRIGVEILAPLQHLGVVLDYVHDHHEHWDGGGYPRGRRGEEITIGGRILVAADAFDALTSKRAYREPMTAEQTLAHLAESTGAFLEPRVFEALQAVVRRKSSLVLTFLED